MKIIKQWVSPQIIKQDPYRVHNAEGLIKMDAMENPYLISADLEQKWLESLRGVAINRYPDPHAESVKSVLKSFMGIPQELPILLGNGSDEIIQIIAMAMSGEGRSILSPAPSFVMYQMIADMLGFSFETVDLDPEDFSLNAGAFLDAIEKINPAIIFLSNPNNPTGNLFEDEVIIEIIKNSSGLVVIDEAYYPFSRQGMLEEISNYENLVVIRTLSKCGLAGLRLGFLIGPNHWLEQFEKIRLPYNVNTLSQKSAEFILSEYSEINEQVHNICQNRDVLYAELKEINSLKVWPSETNFILLRALKNTADNIYSELLKNGVLIKNLHGTHPLLSECLRISIGTEDENKTFLNEIKKIA